MDTIINKKYINENLINKDGNLNSYKLRSIKIPEEYSWCKNTSEYITSILSKRTSRPLCKNCKINTVKWTGSKENPYKKFCSKKCSNSFKDNIEIKITPEYVKKELLTNSNAYNTMKIKHLKIPKEYYWCNTKTEYVNAILHGIKTQPYCKECKTNKVNYQSGKNDNNYYVYCSTECSYKDPLIEEKRKTTSIERYGVNHFSKTEGFNDKISKSNVEKYGVTNTSKLKKFKDKWKKTNIEKYGFENVFQNTDIIKKSKESNFENNGVYYYSQMNIQNYTDYLKCIENDNPEKILNKFVLENQFDYKSCADYFNTSYTNIWRNINKFNPKKLITKSNKTRTQKEIYHSIIEELDKRKIKYNISYNDRTRLGNKKELDIYIELLNEDNTIKKKIAIEYNGLMFHSFGMSKHSMFNNHDKESEFKNSHLLKTKLCEDLDIKLFYIQENEWLDDRKQNIWFSMILNELGIVDKENRIYARKCYIKEVPTQEKIQFINNNHLQGDSVSKINIGLYTKSDNQLVSIMTFSKPRYNKKVDFELIRFCSLTYCSVIGGGSKLLNYFNKNYREYIFPTLSFNSNIQDKMNNKDCSIILKYKISYQKPSLLSYGNRRWTNIDNNFYLINGFVLDNESPINYYNFHESNIMDTFHRSIFMKHKIEKYYDNKEKMINTFDISLTERINMYNNGYRRLYDSGQLVYILK